MAAINDSLTPHIARFKVSSVLNDSHKQFGKAHLFDEDPETCWNSGPGPQFIFVKFEVPVDLCECRVMFQGGFVPKVPQFIKPSIQTEADDACR